jgi:hypothetical protein
VGITFNKIHADANPLFKGIKPGKATAGFCRIGRWITGFLTQKAAHPS